MFYLITYFRNLWLITENETTSNKNVWAGVACAVIVVVLMIVVIVSLLYKKASAQKRDVTQNFLDRNKMVKSLSSDVMYDQYIDVNAIEESAYFTSIPTNPPTQNISHNINPHIQDEYVN